jgi:hypothetical protein
MQNLPGIVIPTTVWLCTTADCALDHCSTAGRCGFQDVPCRGQEGLCRGTAEANPCRAAGRGFGAEGKLPRRWLGTPKLVRETSRRHWWQPGAVMARLGSGGGGEKTAEVVKRDFSDIVLPGGLQDHVRALAAVTANTRAHGAPFRHMLFYGPPGEAAALLWSSSAVRAHAPALWGDALSTLSSTEHELVSACCCSRRRRHPFRLQEGAFGILDAR